MRSLMLPSIFFSALRMKGTKAQSSSRTVPFAIFGAEILSRRDESSLYLSALRGLPPFRFFRMAAILAKYSGPRSAVFVPPLAPSAAAPAFSGSAVRLTSSLDRASAAVRDSRADVMEGCSGISARERSAWLMRLRRALRSWRIDELAMPPR